MTICFPQIITANLCPRDELNFSNTPPSCVRVVPVFQDTAYVIGQFPPPVHFLVTDTGLVYQLAPIQSPPSSVPPEYHALLDSSGCILVGIELSSVTQTPITNAQINVLPGVLRYVLTTLGLPITSITNLLPVERCRRRLWEQIIIPELEDCLTTPPPGPDVPPALSCAFVIACLNAGQNINISAGGTISAGQLVQGPNPGELTWLLPNGTPSFTFVPGGALNVLDTTTVDLTYIANTLSAAVRISTQPGNAISIQPDGLYVSAGGFVVNDTNTVDLTFALGVLSANVIVSPAPGNQLVATPSGLFVPPVTGNRCIGAMPLPPTQPLTPNTLWTIYNNTTQCLEVPLMQDGAIPHHSPGGVMAHVNLFYRPNSLVSIEAGPITITNSQVGFVAGSNGLINNSSGSFLLLEGSSVSSSNNLFGVVTNQSALVSTGNSVFAISNNSNVGNVRSSFVSGTELSANNISTSTVTTQSVSAQNVERSVIAAAFVPQLGQNNGVINSLLAAEGRSDNTTNGLQSVYSSVFVGANTQSGISFPTLLSGAIAVINNANLGAATLADVNAANNAVVNNAFMSSIKANGVSLNDVQSSIVIASASHPSVINATGSAYIYFPGVTVRPHASALLSIASSFVSVLGKMVDAENSVYVEGGDIPSFVGYTNQVLGAVSRLTVPDITPGVDSFAINNAVVAASQSAIRTPNASKENFVMVGSQLSAHRDSMLVLGDNTQTSPAIEAAGGWQVSLSRQAVGQIYELWQDGVFYYRPFGTYPNDAAATAALNAALSTDPRTKVGTTAYVIVAGTPALFTWTGATFTRITV